MLRTGRLAEAPLYIDDSPHLTVVELRANAAASNVVHGDLGLVVDYLQLMSPPRGENRQFDVSESPADSRSSPAICWTPLSSPRPS